jgi:hypothetical protein
MKTKIVKPEENVHVHKTPKPEMPQLSVVDAQAHLSNRTIQRLLAQCSDSGPTELDDATAGRINRARGAGQAPDSAVQTQMS